MINNYIIYLPSIIGALAIALFVLLRSKLLSFRLFGVFSITLATWLTLQFLADSTLVSGKILFSIISATTLLLVLAFFLFSYAYPHHTIKSIRQVLFIALPLIAFIPLSFTSLILEKVSYTDQHPVLTTGILYGLETLVLIGYIFAGILIQFIRLRTVGTREKSQIYFLIAGFILALIGNIFAGYVFSESPFWQIIRPLSILIMLSGIVYAMMYHRLFDIHFFVVRAATYVMTLTLVSIIYIAPILYVVDRLLPGPEMSLPLFLAVLALMSVAAALYENIRKVFNKSTNRLFFREAYDPSKFIAELNQAVVSTLDLKTLLTSATSVVAKNIKSEYCIVELKKTDKLSERVIGTSSKTFSSRDRIIMQKNLSDLDSRIVVTDMLDQNRRDLLNVLKNNNISLVARLVREADTDEEKLGYLLLGPKKDGSAYNIQDIRILDTIVNGLIVAIQNALRFEEIQNFNTTLQQKVENATRQLRHSNEKLKALDETKDDFISMASHQLRTPLTSVKGYLSMVLDGDAGKITSLQKKMLSQAFMSSQHMVYLIADLLNVSRLKTGKFVIESAHLNLADLIQEEIGQLRETAKSRSLELSYEKPKNFPTLLLDETKTRQVVMNFIDNAIHYTPAGGHILVELQDKPHAIELRVFDDGIGVPKAEQPHLFTKFYRALNARRERPDGTGLGLFMAKKVVVAQGGAILFESLEKKGSMFGFTLPKAKLLETSKK